MNTNPNPKEEARAAYREMLKEYRWKKAKAQRALETYINQFQDIRQKLELARLRQEENTQIFEILSPANPLKKKVEDELYRGRIKIQKLEARLEKYSEVKRIKLQLRLKIAEASVKIYERLILETSIVLNPSYAKADRSREIERSLDFPVYFESEREVFLRAG